MGRGVSRRGVFLKQEAGIGVDDSEKQDISSVSGNIHHIQKITQPSAKANAKTIKN